MLRPGRLRPGTRHRADQRAAPEVGEHTDLARVEAGGRPRVPMRFVPAFANPLARAPHVDEGFAAPPSGAVRGREGMSLDRARVGGAASQIRRSPEAVGLRADDLGEVGRRRAFA